MIGHISQPCCCTAQPRSAIRYDAVLLRGILTRRKEGLRTTGLNCLQISGDVLSLVYPSDDRGRNYSQWNLATLA